MAASKHEFAVYWADLPATVGSAEQVIADKELVSRLSCVLRLKVGERCVVFNEQAHAHGELVSFDGTKRCTVRIFAYQKNVPLAPHVTVLLPLLKREDLHQAIYELAACGVNAIQLVHTEKVQAPWRSEKELDRLQRLVIAAAEQSKHFAMPVVHEPVSLADALMRVNKDAVKLFADPAGKTLLEVMTQIDQQHPAHLVVLVGPEGDLTAAEKKLLVQHQFIFSQLTRTVLRAHQAIALLVGAVRSLK